MELCKQRMIDSYRNVSFRGEERGESDYKYYSEMLEKDLALLGENSGKYRDWETDRKSTRLNSSHSAKSRMPSSA